ncbi:n-acetylmuramoyl-l-alanine amidase [Trichococcus flocculiformis]|uniref:N-acetylmuramoyl-L-alanine amidase n=1 Tax=Trichococcus flocculiformis TaxID=82803 RepID=A0AB38BGY6_9LACT|nr:N-acetylmuramoyl-L-alanine amidase [Trichococcus flocculiformis]CZQ83309.1 n-acetylmuramoyl-l-alanine amidase [Trichococcus flocculiformis]SFH70083.1 SH3 domain-containing protein [Trichococcus flocculiformis]
MAYTIIDRRADALGGQRKDRALSAITTIGWHYTAVLRKNRAFITNHEAYWRDTLGWNRGGYHFYIDADGNIYQNYDYERITWGVKDNNWYVVHISVEAGNGNDYSQAQIDAREWLTRKIMADLNIPASKVKGHWEIYNNTSCPGYTKAQMDAFRAKLAQPAGSAAAAAPVAPVQVAPAPTPAPASKWVSESGTFAPDFAINVRSAPNTSGAIVATYNKGQSVRYDSYYNDGHYVWIHYKSYSGYDRYMVCRENGRAWGRFY